MLNFIGFALGAAFLGGDAVSGKQEGGRYYLSDKGRLTEVSATTFRYSRAHAYSVFVAHPLAMLCVFVYAFQKKSKHPPTV